MGTKNYKRYQKYVANRKDDCCLDPRISPTSFRLYSTYVGTDNGHNIELKTILRFQDWFNLSLDEIADAVGNLIEFGYLTQMNINDNIYYEFN